MGATGADGVDVRVLVAEAYEELRARVRAMSRGAPPTLAGTAGLNAALERLLRGRTVFRDRRHFTAACLLAIRRLWLSHRREASRRAARELAAALPALALTGGDAASREGAVAVLELVERLRHDRRVARRRRIARAAALHFLAGFSQAEVAELLGESKAMVQQRLAFFVAWARLQLAPERGHLEAAVAAVAADGRLARGPAIAEAARRHYLDGAPRAAVAAALGVPEAQVKRDLAVFAAWVGAQAAAARGGRGVVEGA